MSYLTQEKHEAIRNVAQKWAWPGGYPLYAVMGDGEVLCPDCVVENIKQVVYASSDRRRWRDTSWSVEGADINYEDEDCHCAHCGKKIPSAYGPQDEEDPAQEPPWGDPDVPEEGGLAQRGEEA